VDGARSNSGEGSGIGLAVVKEIISGHRGIVHAENHGGLAIIIHLPMTEEK
jgi:signal transduction histidine kinase